LTQLIDSTKLTDKTLIGTIKIETFKIF